MPEESIQRKVRPAHPGAILRHMLEELAAEENQFRPLTQQQLAKRLGVSRRALNELMRERGGVTADMAIRLSRVFKTSPEIWMNLQEALDLWDAAKSIRMTTRN